MGIYQYRAKTCYVISLVGNKLYNRVKYRFYEKDERIAEDTVLLRLYLEFSCL